METKHGLTKIDQIQNDGTKTCRTKTFRTKTCQTKTCQTKTCRTNTCRAKIGRTKAVEQKQIKCEVILQVLIEQKLSNKTDQIRSDLISTYTNTNRSKCDQTMSSLKQPIHMSDQTTKYDGRT